MYSNPADYLITPPVARVDPDTVGNWDMLKQRGISNLGDERILIDPAATSCDLSVPEENKAQYTTPFHCKSDKGTLFLTNLRVVYLPSEPTGEPKFESFSAPILNFQNPSATQSSFMWWRGVWKSDCIPVSGGIIPPNLPKIEVKFTFFDGRMLDTFHEKYTMVSQNRSLYNFEQSRSGGCPGGPPGYEARGANPPESTTALTVPRTNQSDSSSSRRAPDEPPPGYDEAQAQ